MTKRRKNSMHHFDPDVLIAFGDYSREKLIFLHRATLSETGSVGVNRKWTLQSYPYGNRMVKDGFFTVGNVKMSARTTTTVFYITKTGRKEYKRLIKLYNKRKKKHE